MPNATFVLKEPTSKDETLVFMKYRFNGHKLKYSAGQNIKHKFWNEEKQRTKETRQFSGYGEFNGLLNKLEASVNDDYRKFINDRIRPTPDRSRT